MRVYRENSRQRGIPMVLKALIGIVLVAGLSLAVAFFWQRQEESAVTDVPAEPLESVSEASSEPDAPSLQAAVFSEDEPLSESESESSEATSDDSSASESSEESDPFSDAPSQPESVSAEQPPDEPGPVRTYAREVQQSAVAANDPVSYRYFDDAMFIGDSITTGIPLYMNTIVPNTAVVAMTGINTDNVNYYQCIDVGGQRVTMLEAALTKGERKKIYIMLGANGISLDKAAFIKGYRAFVESVRENFPDATIYIQSMMPVTVNCYKTYPSVSNEKIKEYNEEIRKMAVSLGTPYLDLGQALEDENGVLPLEASPLDGMHLTPEYYIRWFDYLRTHTVKEGTQ